MPRGLHTHTPHPPHKRKAPCPASEGVNSPCAQPVQALRSDNLDKAELAAQLSAAREELAALRQSSEMTLASARAEVDSASRLAERERAQKAELQAALKSLKEELSDVLHRGERDLQSEPQFSGTKNYGVG